MIISVFLPFRYVYQRGDKPSMTLTIPQHEGTTTNWKLGLKMDTNVQDLHMRTSKASMAFKGKDIIELRPLSNHDFTTSEATIELEFFFDEAEKWESNSAGEIPRWRYPCIAEILTCQLNDNGTLKGNFTVLLTILVGIMVGISCCFACIFCTLKAKLASKQMVQRSTESTTPMEGWRTPEIKYQESSQRFNKQKINTIFND